MGFRGGGERGFGDECEEGAGEDVAEGKAYGAADAVDGPEEEGCEEDSEA